MKNDLQDIFLTLENRERAEIKVKSSKFISTIIPVHSKEEAMQELGTIRTEFYDANHNCFAYRIGPDGMEFRYSDAGEPNSSAGKPILFSIKKYDITDVLVVVTRYFGGTKLGVGGLARAYSDATEEVIKQSKIKQVFITKPVRIFSTYEDHPTVKKLVLENAITYDEIFLEAVEIIANIPVTKIDNFLKKLKDSTGDRATGILMDGS